MLSTKIINRLLREHTCRHYTDPQVQTSLNLSCNMQHVKNGNVHQLTYNTMHAP